MKNKFIFFVTALIACVLIVTFLSCSSRDVERGFVGKIVCLDQNDSITQMIVEVGEDETKNEHRVYYFDNSRSMISKKNYIKNRTLLDVLKDSLCQTIKDLPVGTIVEVIVFSDYAWWQKSPNNLSPYEPKENQMCSLHIKDAVTSRTELLDFVNSIEAIGKRPEGGDYDTHHSIAINDFLTRRQLNGYVNTMYLLTDGDDEHDKPRGQSANIESGKSVLNSRWRVSRNMHCIYVALNGEEYELGTYFLTNKQQKENRHLYHLTGCNTRINLFSIDDSIHIDNALLPHNICFKTNGESPKGITISSSDRYYQCSLTSFNPIAKEVTLRIEPKDTTLPQMHDMEIVLNLEWENDSNRIKNLPSDSLPLIIRCRIPQNGVMSIATPIQMDNAKIKFRKDKVFWNENDPDTLIYKVNYKFSENLANQSNTLQSPCLSIDLGDANDYIELLDAQGVQQSMIKLPIALDTTISFALTIDKNHVNLQRRQNLRGKIMLNDLTYADALYLGKKQIKKHNDSYVLVDNFELDIKQRWELWKWCLVALLLLLALIVIAIIIYFLTCYDNASKFPGDLGQSIVFTGTGLDAPMGFSMNFDGFLVESLAYNAIKTHKLSSTFVQKIIIHNGHYNEYKPTFWEKHTKGDIIYLRSNDFIDGIMEKIEIIPVGKNKEFVAQFKIFSTTNSIEEIQTINLALGQLNTVNSQVNSNERILNYNLTVMGSILIPPTATHSTYTN